MIGEKTIWFDAGLRTPFVGVDGPFAHRESLALSMPVVQAMAPLAVGQIDFAVWLPAWRRTRAGLPPVAIVGNYVGTGSTPAPARPTKCWKHWWAREFCQEPEFSITYTVKLF
jgi:hypothetical protein